MHKLFLTPELLSVIESNRQRPRVSQDLYNIPPEHIAALRRELESDGEFDYTRFNQFWWLKIPQSRLPLLFVTDEVDVPVAITHETATDTHSVDPHISFVAWRRATRDLRVCITHLSGISGIIRMFFTSRGIFVQLTGSNDKLLFEYVISEASLQNYQYFSDKPYISCLLSMEAINLLNNQKSSGMYIEFNHNGTMTCTQYINKNKKSRQGVVTIESYEPNPNSIFKYLLDNSDNIDSVYNSIITDRFRDLQFVECILRPIISRKFTDYAVVDYKSKDEAHDSISMLDKPGSIMSITEDKLVITHNTSTYEHFTIDKSFGGFQMDNISPPNNIKQLVVPPSASTEVFFVVATTPSRNTMGCMSLQVTSTYMAYSYVETDISVSDVVDDEMLI